MQAPACADRGQAVVSWPSDIWRAVIWMALIGRKPSVVNSANGRIGPVDRCCITLTVDFMEPAVLYKGKPLLIKNDCNRENAPTIYFTSIQKTKQKGNFIQGDKSN